MSTIKTFLHDDQRGSVSLWNLFWLVGFLAILGLALDTSTAHHPAPAWSHTTLFR